LNTTRITQDFVFAGRHHNTDNENTYQLISGFCPYKSKQNTLLFFNPAVLLSPFKQHKMRGAGFELIIFHLAATLIITPPFPARI